MLDFNIFYDVIEEDLDSFDIDLAHQYMKTLNHKWYFGTFEEYTGSESTDDEEQYHIPTVKEIRNKLKKDLITGYEFLTENKKIKQYRISSGGFCVECNYSKKDGYWADIFYCPVETIR